MSNFWGAVQNTKKMFVLFIWNDTPKKRLLIVVWER